MSLPCTIVTEILPFTSDLRATAYLTANDLQQYFIIGYTTRESDGSRRPMIFAPKYRSTGINQRISRCFLHLRRIKSCVDLTATQGPCIVSRLHWSSVEDSFCSVVHTTYECRVERLLRDVCLCNGFAVLQRFRYNNNKRWKIAQQQLLLWLLVEKRNFSYPCSAWFRQYIMLNEKTRMVV